MNNAALLRGLAPLLSDPREELFEVRVERTLALEFLFEAIESGKSEVATEVLSHWAATHPRQARSLAGRFPGPLSRRVWQEIVTARRTSLSDGASALGFKFY